MTAAARLGFVVRRLSALAAYIKEGTTQMVPGEGVAFHPELLETPEQR
jgi:hypothetical protein